MKFLLFSRSHGSALNWNKKNIFRNQEGKYTSWVGSTASCASKSIHESRLFTFLMRKPFLFSVFNYKKVILKVIRGFISRVLRSVHNSWTFTCHYQIAVQILLQDSAALAKPSHFNCFGVIKANMQVITQAEEFFTFLSSFIEHITLAHGSPGV